MGIPCKPYGDKQAIGAAQNVFRGDWLFVAENVVSVSLQVFI